MTVDTWIALAALAMSVIAPAVVFIFKNANRDEIDGAIAASETRMAQAVANLNDQHKSLRKTVIRHDRMLVRLEAGLANLPTRKDAEETRVSIERLTGIVGNMQVEIHHLGRSSTANGAKLDRLEKHIYTKEGGDADGT